VAGSGSADNALLGAASRRFQGLRKEVSLGQWDL